MSMQRYIEQLIEDMKETIDSIEQKKSVIQKDEKDQFADVEKFLDGPFHPLGEILGFEKVVLPPIEKLNREQIHELYPVLVDLLEAHNFSPEFPRKVDIALKYHLIREKWHDEFAHMDSGTSHIDFCDYDPSNCPFGKQCDCDNFQES